jgi:hypothetical protein
MACWQTFVHGLAVKPVLPSAGPLNTLRCHPSRSFGPACGGVILLAPPALQHSREGSFAGPAQAVIRIHGHPKDGFWSQ